MTIPEEIVDMLVKEVKARQLLSELRCFNQMTYEELECIIEKYGSEYGMKKIIENLPRYDHWDYHLVKALKSRSLHNVRIANKFSQLFRQARNTNRELNDTLLIHFEYFSCLEILNAPDSRPVMKDLAYKLGFTKGEITDEMFMKDIWEILQDKKASLKHLFSALEALHLTVIHEKILFELGQHAQLNRQTEQYAPQRDHHQLSETASGATARSFDSYFEQNSKEKDKKTFYDKFGTNLSTGEKLPVECQSVGRRTSVEVLSDQGNKLEKFNNITEAEETIVHNTDYSSSQEDDNIVKATPVPLNSRHIDDQIGSNIYESQEEDNNIDIYERNPNNLSEEMLDEPPSSNYTDNRRHNSDNTEGVDSYHKHVQIFSGICFIVVLAFLSHRYYRR